ncbi:hypothetical protein CYMTET_27566 [Cymbomonas tetramitiformis]|uniref:Uncharacterized protein n=1 Tax=Cymbomonas tetramitiformis TaxID=36881 RepID=A0AAE0FR56_9CHLO|nr:hypothetical protein CYMTET_27566 [Cymbomonas tetramitiformis]
MAITAEVARSALDVEERRELIERAWSVYIGLFFELWQNISLLLLGVLYTPSGYIFITSIMHIASAGLNFILMRSFITEERPVRDDDRDTRFYGSVIGATFTSPTTVARGSRGSRGSRGRRFFSALARKPWSLFSSCHYAALAACDAWLFAASFLSVYTCFRSECVYKRAHVLGVDHPCPIDARDYGFIFALVGVFAVYNVINSASQAFRFAKYAHRSATYHYAQQVATIANVVLVALRQTQYFSLVDASSSRVTLISINAILFGAEMVAHGILYWRGRPDRQLRRALELYCAITLFLAFAMTLFTGALCALAVLAPGSDDLAHTAWANAYFGHEVSFPRAMLSRSRGVRLIGLFFFRGINKSRARLSSRSIKMTTTPSLRTDSARLLPNRLGESSTWRARLTVPEQALLRRLVAVMPSDIGTAANPKHGLAWSVIVAMFPSDPVEALLLGSSRWTESLDAQAAKVMGITLDALLDAGLHLRHLRALGWSFRRWNETFGISERFFEEIASSSSASSSSPGTTTLRNIDSLTVGWSADARRESRWSNSEAESHSDRSDDNMPLPVRYLMIDLHI